MENGAGYSDLVVLFGAVASCESGSWRGTRRWFVADLLVETLPTAKEGCHSYGGDGWRNWRSGMGRLAPSRASEKALLAAAVETDGGDGDCSAVLLGCGGGRR